MLRQPRLSTCFLLAAQLLLTACGGDGTSSNQDKKNGKHDHASLNTSAFAGHLAWTLGLRFGVRVRDLANNEMLAIVDPEGEGSDATFPSRPTISANGASFAYALETPFFTAFFSQVQWRHPSLGELHVPTATEDNNIVRYAYAPAIYQDGTLLAFSEMLFNEDEFEDTATAIALWDGAGDVVTLTDHIGAMEPVFNGADEILFWSKHDSSKGDFYRVGTTPGSAVERLHAYDHADLAQITNIERPETKSISREGGYIVYQGSVVGGGTAAWLLKSSDQSIVRVGDFDSVRAVSISGDGSTIVVVDGILNPKVFTVSTASPAQSQLVFEGPMAIHTAALSHDASQVAVVVTDFEEGNSDIGPIRLLLLKADGSTTAVASHDKLENLNASFGMYLTF